LWTFIGQTGRGAGDHAAVVVDRPRGVRRFDGERASSMDDADVDALLADPRKLVVSGG